MLEKIKKGIFPTLIAIAALSVSASAAFYSVTGLSKLFAGASTEVLIMAGSLEVAKLVIATLLHRYWKELNKLLRFYLTSAVVILVLITSMGIYGFLSAAYQETYSKLTVVENEIKYLEKKKEFYEKDLQRYDEELETILANINTLSSAKASSIQVRDTSSATGYRQTISTTELRLAQKRIEVEEENKAKVQEKRNVSSDSLQAYELRILNLKNSSETVGELGPLQYIGGLTGMSMDRIINILLLVIIFVFDPLAISLVVAANFAFDKAKPKQNLYGERVWDEDVFKDFETTTNDGLEEEPWEEIEPDPEDLPEFPDDARGAEPSDWKVVDEEIEYIREKIKEGEESGLAEDFDPVENLKQLKKKVLKVKYEDGTKEEMTPDELKKRLNDDDDLKITYL